MQIVLGWKRMLLFHAKKAAYYSKILAVLYLPQKRYVQN